ncbi:MAG TPA: aminoacyl-tRNA hydrolase [Candidatus Latescibacteria bacterium]|nr:aminoacyl-tRNA hydrolase [Candidatus Latescibacterota bacterium]
MYTVIGLGNPGEQYRRTRHNIGSVVVERLAKCVGGKWKGGENCYLFTRVLIEGTPVLLVKPTTFMNSSGIAVAELIRRFEVPITELVVVSDDVNLPLGKIRLRAKGSDGGHKGLASLIYHLGSEHFPRLRLGIGSPPEAVDLVDYVLSEFEGEELPKVEEMVSRAIVVIRVLVCAGIEKAMTFLSLM